MHNIYIKDKKIVMHKVFNSDKINITKIYNDLIDIYDQEKTSWIIFCHEDFELLENPIQILENCDKSYIYGTFGARIIRTPSGKLYREYVGKIFDSNKENTNFRILGSDFINKTTVDTLDCQCIIIHSETLQKYKLRFDPRLRFNLYVEDFCLTALIKYKIQSKVLQIQCCHHSQSDGCLDLYPDFHSDLSIFEQKYAGKGQFAGICNIVNQQDEISTLGINIMNLSDNQYKNILNNNNNNNYNKMMDDKKRRGGDSECSPLLQYLPDNGLLREKPSLGNIFFNKSYYDLLYDISGCCNAKCMWCERGARNRKVLSPAFSKKEQTPFATPEAVYFTLKYLIDAHLISNNTCVHLYNWGEPFLNPNLEEILYIICKFNLTFSLSTNGSIIFRPKIKNIFANAQFIIVTMPGFSEYSYIKSSGLDFSDTKNKIIDQSVIFFEYGLMKDKFFIHSHLTKYNIGEMWHINNFSKKINARLHIGLAIMYSLDFAIPYYSNTINYSIRNIIDSELYIPKLDLIKKIRPNNFKCSSSQCISLSCNAKVGLGCCARLSKDFYEKEYAITDIHTIDLINLYYLHKNNQTCNECKKIGYDFMITNPNAFIPYLLSKNELNIINIY
jgi:organic radical activating enzyme